jgi:pimeloyl-ACP methyl ester carboxylesterase
MMLAWAAMAAAAALAVFLDYRSDIAYARVRVATQGRIAQTACGPIEYALAGKGQPLLVVHGAGGGFDQGLEVMAPLAASGFRVIAVSRFGYLGTPLPADASARAQAKAHACLLDSLGIESAAVLGMSAGGPSAMEFAARYPARTTHLVLIVPAAYAPKPGGDTAMEHPREVPFLFDTALRSDFLFWALIHGAPELAYRTILGTPDALVAAASDPEKARLDRLMNSILPVAPRRPGLVNDAIVTTHLERIELERITAPTLIFSARDDGYKTWDGAQYSAQHIPHARFVGYPVGGHLLVGHEQEETREILAFLRPATSSSPST